MIQYSYCLIFTLVLRQSSAVYDINITNHPVWKKLDAFECGDSAADRIIGGVNAALGQYPWIVRLGYKSQYEEEIDWMCGGALISDRHVITAAHCLNSPGDEYQLSVLRLGEHNALTDVDCQQGVCAPPVQDRKIKVINSHPKFNNPLFHNDLAILEMEKPVQLNEYVAPICLPRTEEQMAQLQIADQVTVAGWGKMNMTTQQRADILQVVTLPIVQPDQCATFGKQFKMTEAEICAGAQKNKDACGGDSGGPLMRVYDTREGPKNFLVGVVSFGPALCGIKKPGVYTSVPYFLNWILNNINL